MTEIQLNTQIPVIFQKLEEYKKDDSRFLKVKIWLMHTGQNFNGSAFSKEAVEKAIPTLANTPILSFIEENDEGNKDFSDHRMALTRTADGDFNLKYLGSAVGVIPETNNAHWEMRVTDSGEEKEYLVVEALMWTKWDDPTDIMTNKGTVAQSMELSNSYTGTVDDNGVFHFETFEFWGACLLGEGVQPAMQNSTAELQFTENAKATQKTIENKLDEFYTLFSQQGGTKMEDKSKQEEVEVFEEAVEEVAVEASEETTVEETETPVEEVFEAETTEVAETTEESTEEETVEEPAVEEVEQVDYETKFNDLNSEFTSIQDELKELREYKRSREESDLQAQFADKLSEDEFTQVFESMKENEMSQVEEKLFALIGKKNFSATKPATPVNKVVLGLPKEEDAIKSPYGGLFEKYNN